MLYADIMTDTNLIEQRLESMKLRYKELQEAVANPELPKTPGIYKDTMREYGQMEEIMSAYTEFLAKKK